MTLEFDKLMDETSWRLLVELQENARLSYTELGQRVGLTSPAVAERIKKMEDLGIIKGYRVEVNTDKLGLPVQTIIYLEHVGGRSCKNAVNEIATLPEILECYRLTGTDAIILKAVTTSLDHLAQLIDHLSEFGIPKTSIIRSKSVIQNSITADALYFEDDED